ncbi:helix-hairpin-helix domain-containing protein [Pedobacter chitinilyticus]|uniref:Helix-hairpin-helix domain-containing protein n=1 Tax=Pedobacter chitinilyticus TaxID=2233776 RepID=A0A443Z180_9SPHI|nr:helix-hairpin-helix domain-containing protein [Pedobacter chitinilyticus]RWU10264.1 helix-hairpin-helix domain-containing protein [Pedobacter chitinilyticus]
MRFRLLVLFALLLIGFAAKAQTQEDQLIKDLIESIAENLPEDYDLSELQDRLTYYRKHPINLNNTTAEELKTLVFLSPLQISNLFEHIRKNGKLIDLLELQSIPEFDIQTIQRLLPFATLEQSAMVDKITAANLLKYGNNDLILRYGRVIEKSKGYTDLPGSKYLGTPDRYLFRYRYTYSNRVSASLVFEKDAGEHFFRGPKQKPFDFLSGHIAFLNTGRFKKIVLGDYTMQFGQALTLWSGFAFGKSPDVTGVAKRDVGLRPYTSANEFAFLRGAAMTVNIAKNIDFSPFVSHRKLDASMTTIDGVNMVSTINETGLHRTQSEINNKNNLEQTVYGGVLQYRTSALSIGAVAYHTSFNRTFTPGTGLYRIHNFTGKELTNVGAHYSYTYKNFYFFGEFGKSLDAGLAYVNGALVSLSSTVSAVLLHRNYQKNYHNFFNQATAEASEAFNEKGFYAGLNINPSKVWSIQVYGDYFKFPWLRFRVDAPSDGYEFLGQVTYSPTKTFRAILRYKTEVKQQNTNLTVPFNYLDEVKRENYRAEVKWAVGKSFGFQNRVEVVQFRKGDAKAEFGYLAYQDVSYSPLSSRLSGNIRVAYFNTASYDSRIYAYEDDVLYNFTFGLYNGKGLRGYANLKYRLAKRIDLWGRYALYNYDNVETVGSGLDEINGKMKSEMRIQLRYQF